MSLFGSKVSRNKILTSLMMQRVSDKKYKSEHPEIQFLTQKKTKEKTKIGLSGWFEMRVGSSRIWKNRYCEIDHESCSLYYYPEKKSSEKSDIEGVIDLESVTSVARCSMITMQAPRTKYDDNNKHFCFKVLSNEQVYLFSAQDQESVEKWTKVINDFTSDELILFSTDSDRIPVPMSNLDKLLSLSSRHSSGDLLCAIKATQTFCGIRGNITMVPEFSQLAIQDCDLDTPDYWVKRHPALHRLTGNHPVNAEPRLNYFDFTVLTPKEIAFVRNHGPCPKIASHDWDLTIISALGEKFVFKLNDLKSFRSEALMATCICAGIRRMELNVVKMTKGSNYGNGAWHTGFFEGVMLRDIFSSCGIKPTRGKYEWVETEGHEDLPKGKYTTCIPLERVMDYSQDVMLAYLQNGDPLMPDHGFPVRLIAPGIFGGRWTKCIRKIRILDHESKHFYHLHDNRVLPPFVEADTPNINKYFENNLYTYWYHPVNSYITEPRHGTVCPLAQGGNVPIRGVAYNGNGVMITRIEISLDGGNKWRPCNIHYTSQARHGCKYWNPFFWEPEQPVTTFEIFSKKVDEIVVRAFDQCLNTQPTNSTWNLLGFANNSLYRVKLVTRISRNGPAYQFIHPVSQCAKTNDCTGWISEERNEERQRWLAPPKNEKYLPPISREEVRKHCIKDDAWFIIDSVVYNITQYIKDNKHPGGNATLLPFLGLDCSDAFHAVGHSPAAQPDLDACAIGVCDLIPGSSMKRNISMLSAVDVPDAIEMPFKLIHKEVINVSKTLIKIVLLGPAGTGYIADEPIGSHYSIINDNVRRSYTPLGINKQGDCAEIEFSIKVYEDGELTRWIDQQEIGETILMAGPKGNVNYAVEKLGYFTIAGQTAKRYKKVSMVAGGTGIAPMLQLLRYIYQNTKENKERKDLHDLALVYSIRTEDEIMERSELEKYGDNFVTLRFHATKQLGKRVDKDIIENVCGVGTDGALALICGPPRFCDAMATYFSQLDYDSIVTY